MKKIVILFCLSINTLSYCQWTGPSGIIRNNTGSSTDNIFSNPAYFVGAIGGSISGNFVAKLEVGSVFYIGKNYKAPFRIGIDATYIGCRYVSTPPDSSGISYQGISLWQSIGVIFSYNPGRSHILDLSYQFLGYNLYDFLYIDYGIFAGYHHQLYVNYRYKGLIVGPAFYFNHYDDKVGVDICLRLGVNLGKSGIANGRTK